MYQVRMRRRQAKPNEAEDHHLFSKGVSAGELQQKQQFAAEMVNFMGTTEAQAGKVKRVDQGIQETRYPITQQHLHTDMLAHSGAVAYGSILMICHCREEKNLCSKHENKEEYLGNAATE